MMNRTRTTIALFVLAAGCGHRPGMLTKTSPDVVAAAVEAMRNADTFELISLDPNARPTTRPSDHAGVLGRTLVTDRAMRERIIEAFRAAAWQRDDVANACIPRPRHALHLVCGEDGCDITICFECGDVEMRHKGGASGHFFVRKEAEQAFDDALRAAGIPLAAKDG